MNDRTSGARHVMLLRRIAAWLRTMPRDLRRLPGPMTDEVGDEVVYRQLRFDEGGSADRVRACVEGIAALADEARWDLGGAEFRALTRLLVREPRIPDLGLLVCLASYSRVQDTPRDQGFYPAVLLEEHVLAPITQAFGCESVKTADGCAFRLVGLAVAARDPTGSAVLSRTSATIERGYGSTVRWPTQAQACATSRALARVARPWQEVATRLLTALRADGGLPIEAVLREVSSATVSTPDVEVLVARVSHRGPKATPQQRLRRVLGWPVFAESIFEPLGADEGWLRLYAGYLRRVLGAICGDAARPPDEVARRFDVLLARDVLHPIAVTIRGCDDDHPGLTLAERQRLHRQRERCLHGALDPVDDESIDLYREIAARYFAACGVRVPGKEGSRG